MWQNSAERNWELPRIELLVFLHFVLSQVAGNSWPEFFSVFNEVNT